MKVASLILGLIFVSSPALALPPTKSSVCALSLNAISQYSSRKDLDVYTLNSLLAFKENTLGVTKLSADAPEGFATDREFSQGFGPEELAKRINGIDQFSTRENRKISEGHMSFYLVLSGRDNIRHFLETFKMSTSIVNRQIFWNVMNRYKTVFLVGSLLIPAQFFDHLSTGHFNATVLTVLAALGLTSRADHFLMRPFYKDRQIYPAIKAFKGVLDLSEGEKGWAFFSRNAILSTTTLDAARNPQVSTEDLSTPLTQQSIDEVPSLLARLDREPEEVNWSAFDMFLEKRRREEPELHIIFRSAKSRPTFPERKPASIKKDQNSPVVELELEPAAH